ncbi:MULTISPECIES: hypothetical protein, partial [Kribbella]|uniref:hypothetical protein n=1 Tax=Kribbella TaxID=182639 RepID=UPI001A7E3F6F
VAHAAARRRPHRRPGVAAAGSEPVALKLGCRLMFAIDDLNGLEALMPSISSEIAAQAISNTPRKEELCPRSS